ncbi:MAG: hypothetical protein J5777_07435 [Clostridiales bacterium]|nr:hypothetical protein [Clostridiales bacterium]
MSLQQPGYQPQYQSVQQLPVQGRSSAPDDGFKGGFNRFYIWPIASLVLTYGYVFIFSAMSNLLRDTYSSGLDKIQISVLFFPLLITIANTVIAILCSRKVDRRYFLGASLIIKYGLIPYFIVGGLLIVIFFLLIFTPVVIMIFVSPPIIIALSVIGWISMSESAPFMIVYFVKAAKEGALSGKKTGNKGGIALAVIGSIMQMFFCLDVAAAVIACFKEKRHTKLSVVVLAGPAVIFGVTIAVLIISALLKK